MRLLRLLSSPRLTLILLAIIILVLILGTLIPQGLSSQEYIKKYGINLFRIFNFFKLTNLYHSFCFFFLLFLFAFNLFLCTLRNLKSRKNTGLIITHISIIVILSGSLITAIFRKKGFLGIYEGQIKEDFLIGEKSFPLNFKIILEDFTVEYYEPDIHQLYVYLKDKDKKFFFKAKNLENYKIPGTDYSFRILKYICDFFIDESGKIINKSFQPKNPAVLLEIKTPQTKEERWIFAKERPRHKDSNIEFFYDFRELIKDYKSKVKIIEGEKVLTKTIRVNEPLKYKGYIFYQASYNPEEPDWTGLQVSKDPGYPVVFLGFILLVIGLFGNFYKKKI
ncbi:MAG: cytochrome c biogenesis protein ResB [Candidatus Omnitrophica bacterium]|nr:cytochrome c biogenesis protein ResB [Candidatus Omnitrophota bacterium]